MMAKRFVLFLQLLLLLCVPAALAAQERVETIRVGADEFVHYSLPSREGPPVDYYITRTARPAPLLLHIQGSGCAPVFIQMSPGTWASTIFSLTTVAHRGDFAVMVVNKAYAPAQRPRDSGVASNCPAAFNAHFSLDTWVRRIEAAYRHARSRPWVRGGRSLVIGLSEGTTVATALAAIDPAVSDLALVGANGPGQLFDFFVRAYQEGPNGEASVEALREVEAQFARIRAAPDSSTDFAWGHTYKRWSSFFRSPSIANLRRSNARVYLVSGMEDRSVPIYSTELLYSQLLIDGRDVEFRRIPGADHGLLRQGADFQQAMPTLEAEYARILDWFRAGPAGR